MTFPSSCTRYGQLSRTGKEEGGREAWCRLTDDAAGREEVPLPEEQRVGEGACSLCLAEDEVKGQRTKRGNVFWQGDQQPLLFLQFSLARFPSTLVLNALPNEQLMPPVHLSRQDHCLLSFMQVFCKIGQLENELVRTLPSHVCGFVHISIWRRHDFGMTGVNVRATCT